MHRTILSAGFDGLLKSDIGRVLFRIDGDSTGRLPPVVLVQSEREPDWENLTMDYLASLPECKPFAPQFKRGQRLRFRLRANPTKRVAAKNAVLGPEHAGKRIGLFTEADQLRWFISKGAKGGFRVPGGWVENGSHAVPNFRMDAIPEGKLWNGISGAGGWFLAVRFEGVLEVTDPTSFLQLLENGIGSAKGYGFGLMSVAPA
jgi:CRISPR system Cascade subunit CasE